MRRFPIPFRARPRSAPHSSPGARLARSLLVAVIVGGLLSAAAADLGAQDRGSLVGIVVDGSDGSVLTEARVSVVESRHTAAADDEGRFLLPDLPASQLTLRVEAPGYSTVVERIEVSSTDVNFMRVELPRMEALLRELLVRGSRTGSGSSETEVRSDPGDVRSRTAADLLAQEVPGVEIIQGHGSVGTGAAIRIRGVKSITQSNAPAVYLDGVRVDPGNAPASAGRSQTILHVLQTISAHEVERIRVLRGPSAEARYGDSVNGVILIETRRGGDGGGEGGGQGDDGG